MNYFCIEGSTYAFADNAGTLLAKQKFRVTNWHFYNNFIISCGSMTFWWDNKAIKAWYCKYPA
ncbi:hypothetical protein VEGS15_28680 [Escherichia coli]|nr:hypothetical protein VEGS15_28680 [Escherichia coli]